MKDNMSANICFACVKDQFLAEEISAEGNCRPCHYCDNTQEAITLRSLAVRIHNVLQKQFELAPMEIHDQIEHFGFHGGVLERRGEDVTDLIAKIAGLSEDLACAVRSVLSKTYATQEVSFPDVAPYDIDAVYRERNPNDGPFRVTWAKFCEEVVSQARFFSHEAEEKLNEVFGNLGMLETVNGEPVVRELSPGDPESSFWRARRIENENSFTPMLRDPPQEIGPPPSERATSGRMNARGIPVFYGATCENACISEIRAPVGSSVLIGSFRLLRPTKLLDLESITNVFAGGSHFDPRYEEKRGRASFLKDLVTEISRPVMPEDEELEYIPTQIVAEYLAQKANPRIDGILYPSSQTDGNNVVLFNHACRVRPSGLPEETEIEVDDWRTEEYKEMFGVVDVYVTEIIPDDHQEAEFTDPEVTLELDSYSVRVLEIKSVEYRYDSYRVSRDRTTKSEKLRKLETN